MAHQSLLNATRAPSQPLLFGEPTRSPDRSVQPIGALVPPGMTLIYQLSDLPGYEDAEKNPDSDGGWVLERPGVWHHEATGHRFVEPPRPEQLQAAQCADCRRHERKKAA